MDIDCLCPKVHLAEQRIIISKTRQGRDMSVYTILQNHLKLLVKCESYTSYHMQTACFINLEARPSC